MTRIPQCSQGNAPRGAERGGTELGCYSICFIAIQNGGRGPGPDGLGGGRAAVLILNAEGGESRVAGATVRPRRGLPGWGVWLLRMGDHSE